MTAPSYDVFKEYGLQLNVDIPVIDAAWSYVTRFKEATDKEWPQEAVYVYASLSLASKINSDQYTTDDLLFRLCRHIRTVFKDDLAAREVEIATALKWNLWYEHPTPPAPPSR